MILLERIAAHNFKQLREVELTIPRVCRVLVEGLNEAGKSTLFEAIHYAIYGRGLVTLGRGRGSGESLIAYGADRATVEVGLLIDNTPLRVTRTLVRGRPSLAVCRVGQPGGSWEEVRQPQKVNEEVLAQLNGLDSDALLASCFVEQKKLGKLEDLSREKRQEVLLKLLDLDRLIRVRRRFAWERHDELRLAVAEGKVRLVQAVRRLEQLAEELARLDRNIILARIHQDLQLAERQARQARTFEHEIEALSRQLEAVEARIARAEALDRAIDLLGRVLAHGRTITSCLEQARGYERDLADIDRTERETIPTLQAEDAVLGMLAGRLEAVAALDTEIERLRERARRCAALVRDGQALEGTRAELGRLRSVAREEDRLAGAAGESVHLAEQVVELRRQADQAEATAAQRRELGGRILRHADDWANARAREAAAAAHEPEVAAAEEWAAAAAGLAQRAREAEELRARLREIERQEREAQSRQAQLADLRAQQASVRALADAAVAAEREDQAASQRAEAAQERARRRLAVVTLREWGQAAREVEVRRRGEDLLAQLDRAATEARARHREALARTRRSALVVAGALAVIFLGILLSIAVDPRAGVLALVGLGLGVWSWRQRASAAGEQRTAGAEVELKLGAARDERVRQETLAGKMAPDLAPLEARLKALGGAVPGSAAAGEALAIELEQSLPPGASLAALETVARDEQATASARREAALDARARANAAQGQLAALLERQGLESLAALGEREGELAEEVSRRAVEHGALERQLAEAASALPAGRGMQELASEAEQTGLDAQRRRQALGYERQRSVEDRERAAAELRQLGIEDPAAASTTAETYDRAALDLSEQGQRLRADAARAEQRLPAGWTIEALRMARDEAIDALRQAELAAQDQEAQARQAASALADQLRTEGLGDWEMARDAHAAAEGQAEQRTGERAQRWEQVAAAGAPYALPEQVEAARGVVLHERARVDQQQKQAGERLASRGSIQRRLEGVLQEADRVRVDQAELRREARLIFAQLELSLPSEDRVEPSMAELRAQRAELELDALRQERAGLLRQRGTAEANQRRARQDEQQARTGAAERVVSLGACAPAEVTLSALLPLLPGLQEVSADQLPAFEQCRIDLLAQQKREEQTAGELEARLHVRRNELEDASCREEATQLGRRKRMCERSVPILDRVRENVLQAVLPHTMAYMRLLLPLLTAGRYHDAQLDDASYQIEVWDSQVQGFVEKDIFSGASQDQFSLALRLGFALAALPQERGARPGFLFLDEPVAGFDGQRRDALMDLLLTGELADYFPQVFLAVPEGVFHHNPLPYLVRLQDGRVVGSTLPVSEVAQPVAIL